MLGSAGLNAMGQSVHLFHSTLIAGTVSVITCVLAGTYAGAYGAAAAFVAAEVALQLAILSKYLSTPKIEVAWK